MRFQTVLRSVSEFVGLLVVELGVCFGLAAAFLTSWTGDARTGFATDEFIVESTSPDELKVHEFAPDDIGGLGEARVFVHLEARPPMRFHQYEEMQLRVAVYGQSGEPVPLYSTSAVCAEGATVPITREASRIVVYANNLPAGQWQIRIGVSHRSNTLLGVGLTKGALELFDQRFNRFHTNHGRHSVRTVYGLPRIRSVGDLVAGLCDRELSQFDCVLPFDHTKELRDMIDPECKIVIGDGDGAVHRSREEFVRFIGKTHFSFGISMRNVKSPTIRIYDGHAYVVSRKRMEGTDAQLKPNPEYALFTSTVRIEVRRGRLAATEIVFNQYETRKRKQSAIWRRVRSAFRTVRLLVP